MYLLENPNEILERTCSYLNTHDLAKFGQSCKTMTSMIFGEDASNICWEGAERTLATKTCLELVLDSVPSSKNRCHLFVLASKHAQLCDESETLPDGNGEMTAAEAHERLVRANNDNAEVEDENKEYQVFVRVTRNNTNELVGHGFVPYACMPYSVHPHVEQQRSILYITPNILLKNSEEFLYCSQNTKHSEDGSATYKGERALADTFRYAVVAISKNDMTDVRLITCVRPASTIYERGLFDEFMLFEPRVQQIEHGVLTKHELLVFPKWNSPQHPLLPHIIGFCAQVSKENGTFGQLSLGLYLHLPLW